MDKKEKSLTPAVVGSSASTPLRLVGLLRRHSRLVVLMLILVGATTAGIYFWSEYHLRAAENAIERYALDEAKQHLDRCLIVRFRSARVHLLAAQTARRRDAYDEAEKHLTACVQLQGKPEAVALERLLLTAQRGDLDDVEKLLKARADAKDAEAVLVLEALAKGYLSRFWKADAVACLNKLLARQPRHPQAWLWRARAWECLAASGETERENDALSDYEKAVELEPSFEARLGLAGALYRVGRPWDAMLEFEALLHLQAANPDAILGLARCRYSLHEVVEAARLLDQLLEQQPDNATALLERGRLAFHAGRLAEAETWLRQAEAAAPLYDCDACRFLYQCLATLNKDEEARQCLDRLRQKETNVLRVDRLILQANREPGNVALRFEIAMKLMRLGREQDAVSGLFLVLEQERRHGAAQAALADYFEQVGERDRAARHRRAILQRAESNAGSR